MTSINLLIKAFPQMSKDDLFNISVYNNIQEDVEYLLKNHKSEINVMGVDNGNFLLDCIEKNKNPNMLIFILMHGSGKLSTNNPRFTYTNLFKKFPPMIPYLVARLKFEKRITKEIISELVDIALDRNSSKIMKILLEFKEHMNEYRYTLLACGGGSVSDVIEHKDTVKEMADECIETAYFCENFPVVEYLQKNFQITNPFLSEKIRESCMMHHVKA